MICNRIGVTSKNLSQCPVSWIMVHPKIVLAGVPQNVTVDTVHSNLRWAIRPLTLYHMFPAKL